MVGRVKEGESGRNPAVGPAGRVVGDAGLATVPPPDAPIPSDGRVPLKVGKAGLVEGKAGRVVALPTDGRGMAGFVIVGRESRELGRRFAEAGGRVAGRLTFAGRE